MFNNSAKQQLYIILLIVLLGFIGNSIAYPIFAPLFLHPAHGDIVPSSWNPSWRSLWLGATLMMYPLGQFVGSPILGALSDRYGRKTVLVISAWLMTLFYLLTAMSLSLRMLWLLILSRFLTGCAEGNISIARAMVVDIKELNKHKSIGLISAMSAFGYILGPIIGGTLADKKLVAWFDFAVPFYAAALLSLIVVSLAAIYLRESLSQSHNSKINIIQQFNIIKRLKRLCQNKTLAILLLTSSIASLSYDTFYEFYPAYMTGLWHATSMQIAWYTAILSATIAFGCGWFSNYLAQYISSKKIIIFSMPTIFLVLICLLLLPPKWLVMIVFVIIGLAIAVTTNNYTLQVSEAADSKIQGEVFGTLWGLRMLLDGLTSIVGGLLIMLAYSLPLAVAAVIALIGWIIYYGNFRTIDS